MRFIEVLGIQCNSQGLTRGASVEERFYLNLDLVAGIEDSFIRLKGGDLLIMGGKYFKDIRIANNSDLQKLVM